MDIQSTSTNGHSTTNSKVGKTVSISNRLELSPTQPIPFEQGKAFSYVHKDYYLPFLDTDNNYAKLLLEARLLSGAGNACVVTKKDYCAGSGFQTNDDIDLPQPIIDWLSVMNLKGESANALCKRMFEDIFTFGNVPIELVRFNVGNERRLYVYVHDFLEWRLGEPDSDDIVQEALQSKLFRNEMNTLTAKQFEDIKRLPIYNPRNLDKDNWKKIGNSERTLIWYKNQVSGFPHYGIPSNVAGLIYQFLEYKGARYNLDNFDNNMVISAILALKGNITQTEANRIGKQAVKNHTGDGKIGRIMVVASEEGIDGSDFHNFDTHKEGSFEASDNTWTQKIILCNQWDAVLAGILSSSTFGKGSGFLTKILEIKQNTVIKPAQKDIIEKVWSHVFSIANDWLGLNIDSSNMIIENSIDISGLTDVDITPVVKADEVRTSKGLSKLGGKKGEMLLGEMSANQKKGVYVKAPGNANPGTNSGGAPTPAGG